MELNTTIQLGKKTYTANLLKPLDISIPLHSGPNNIHAWYVGDATFKAVENENWIGDVNKGGAVNFRDIYFNPHGHGTHTECVGHISKENYTINKCLTQFFFAAQLITVSPQQVGNDQIILLQQLKSMLILENVKALVIRTTPNLKDKLKKNYSSTNPPFIEAEAIAYLIELGIDHLLVDLPSVDKEQDEGKLAAHHQFWQYPNNTQAHRTITEFVFIDDAIIDGLYLLNLQISPFENDAAPSKPILFELIESIL